MYAPRPGDPVATNIVWDAGRSELWFIGADALGRGGIWALPVGGGRPRLVVDLRDPAGRLNGPTFTSDGKRFYFTLDERLGNIHWAELLRR